MNQQIIIHKRHSMGDHGYCASPIQFFLLCLFSLILLLTGCGDGSGESTFEGNSGDGTLFVALTDAPGDFLSYTVDITDLTMTKANGAVVHVLPLSTRLDFAEYTELTEFLTAAMIPVGAYTTATLSLDYQNADIWVEDETGNAVKVNSIQDSDGNDIGALDVSVRLEGRHQLFIAPGVPAHITLDFNLNASNKVEFDISTGEPSVVVEPFLLADVALERPKIHRLRGPIASVDVGRSSFEMIIRPFRHAHINDRRFGTMRVISNENTRYEINEEDFIGSTGLEALDRMPTFTAAIVIGDLKFNPRRFEAREVYAGSSVPGGTLDVVRGTVLARAGDVLTVKGATLIRAGGSVIFNDTVSVILAETTRVHKQLSPDLHDIGDISVGQRVSIFGSLLNLSTEGMELNATDGFVRMLLTKLRATSIGVTINSESTTLTADLQSINHRRIMQFDFAGTGIDVANDADPSNYQIDTGTMDLSNIAMNTAIIVKGFVTPFGTAPADFSANSVVDLSMVPAILSMNWRPSTVTPFIDISTTGLTLNLDGSGLFHHVGRAGVITDLNDLISAPVIVPSDANSGLFVIAEGGTRQLYTRFADFVTGIETRLSEGSSVKRIMATGFFNDSEASFRATRVYVLMMPISSIN